jgi:hypothetical protein
MTDRQAKPDERERPDREERRRREERERRADDLRDAWRRRHPGEPEEGGKDRPRRGRR